MRHLEYPDIPYHALLERAAARQPDKVAITFGERRLTFAEWNSDASRLANGVLELGVGKGDRVALLLPNCPEYEISFFGVTRMGGAPTPLNPSYKQREIRSQLVDSGAKAVIVHERLYPTLVTALDGLTGVKHVIVVEEGGRTDAVGFWELVESQRDELPNVQLESNDLAALPYSSGTTGTSKGVMLTQRNLVSNALQFVDSTGTTEEDNVLVFLPLYHIYGAALTGCCMAGGASHVLMERFQLTQMLDLVMSHRITELFVVPPVMLALAGSPQVEARQLASLRFLMSAAAPLAPDVGRRVAERLGVHVIQAYGMTEASPLTHMVPLDEDGFDTVGVVAADTECRIVDLVEGVREVPTGDVGEVTVRGPQVMAAYWNAPDDTAQALRDGWLYTGDVGKVDEAGRLYVVDRKKEMIKYKAFSIAPAELEAVLLEHPAVQDCAVTAQADEEAGEVPRAHVVLRPGAAASAETLQAFVAERVAGYKQIRSVEILDEIPRTPSGKVLRRVLKERTLAAIH